MLQFNISEILIRRLCTVWSIKSFFLNFFMRFNFFEIKFVSQNKQIICRETISINIMQIVIKNL